jgi:hypothetical protein
MSFRIVGLSILSGVFILIAGCVGNGSVGSSGGGGGGGNSTTVTVTFTGATPTAVATQIGSGSYTAVTPANTITLKLPNGMTNFAVAYVCTVSFPPSGATPSLEIFQNVVEASATDGVNLVEASQCATTTGPATGVLTGSIDGSAIPGVMAFGISQGEGFTGSNLYTGANLGDPDISFSVGEPVGTRRVLVTAYNTAALLAARNFDNQPVPGALNNGNTVVLGPADETTSQTISYNNVPSGFTNTASAGYGTYAELVMNEFEGVVLAWPATTQYPVLPAGAIESGDYYLVNTSAGNGEETMIIVKTSPSGVPIAFTFPPAWGYSGPTPAALPTFNVAYAGFTGGSGLNYQVGFYWDPDNDTRAFYYISASGNYLNGSNSIVFPDLTGLPGFYKPASGAIVPWNAAISKVAYDSTLSSPKNATTTTISDTGRYLVP